ncbi:MAG: glycerol-3-phosphate dehydrogenase [Hyphomicrobiales bacterium]|nr:glycerol-3-phosphate dehydrogenase [Hyphomicrobiales bacterium]
MPPTVYDILIIGGGVNGTGIARDAAGRGFSSCVAEMNDLASGTSSKATKLIHGGLRYLEYYEFRLVREALRERETLLRMAPHLVRPLRFVLPWRAGLRPAWLLRLGLFIYDHLGGRRDLPPTRTLDLAQDEAGAPLKTGFRKAFEYSDCWVDDARLVAMNARDAADRGARIATRCKVVRCATQDDLWRVTVEHSNERSHEEILARLIVNAAGPWVDVALAGPLAHRNPHHVRLVQGSHIVVRKLYDHDRCYFFQNPDGRIFFAIPYEDAFTLIGTTDRDYVGDPGAASIGEDEIAYLCRGASDYFARAIAPSDVVWSYSGVRPLYDDGASAAQEATRDYIIETERFGAAPLINIFGGKITTYRKLSEQIMTCIEAAIGRRGGAWTETSTLPGGDFAAGGRIGFENDLRSRYPFLTARTVARFARSYGTRALLFLRDARVASDLGADFGAGLTQAEVDYLVAQEWAQTPEDILWRRTKIGLHAPPETEASLRAYLETKRSQA